MYHTATATQLCCVEQLYYCSFTRMRSRRLRACSRAVTPECSCTAFYMRKKQLCADLLAISTWSLALGIGALRR